MSTETERRPTSSGWCASLGKPDQHHDECTRRLAAGLLAGCGCPKHQEASG